MQPQLICPEPLTIAMPTILTMLRYALALAFVLIAVYTDWKAYKIKNRFVLLFAGLGLALNAVFYGLPGLQDALFGLLVPLALFPLFALRMLGGGDIKALCAVGSIVGYSASIQTVLFSFLAGGAIALGFMIFRRNAWQRAKQFVSYVKQCFWMGKLLPYDQFTDEKSAFRFSFGILGGFLAAAIWVYPAG